MRNRGKAAAIYRGNRWPIGSVPTDVLDISVFKVPELSRTVKSLTPERSTCLSSVKSLPAGRRRRNWSETSPQGLAQSISKTRK